MFWEPFQRTWKLRLLGLPSLQKCVCEIWFGIWFGIWFEIWTFRCEKSGEVWGEDFSTFRSQKKEVFRRGFCKYVRLSWLWRSECQMYCWAQCPWLFFVSLGVTAETPFAKTPFSCLLITARKAWNISGRISGRISEKDSDTSFQISRLFSETSFSRRAVLMRLSAFARVCLRSFAFVSTPLVLHPPLRHPEPIALNFSDIPGHRACYAPIFAPSQPKGPRRRGSTQSIF